jgi:hypothetical protein
MSIAENVLRDANIGGELVKVEAMTKEQREREASQPQLPELVAATDVAKILGVSRQRVNQLHHDHRDFPRRLLARAAVRSGRDTRSNDSPSPGIAVPAAATPTPGPWSSRFEHATVARGLRTFTSASRHSPPITAVPASPSRRAPRRARPRAARDIPTNHRPGRPSSICTDPPCSPEPAHRRSGVVGRVSPPGLLRGSRGFAAVS